jgi:acyl-CoA dehydrogenase
VLAGYRDLADHVAALNDPAFGATAVRLEEAISALERASKQLIAAKPEDALAGATPYLRLFGLTAGAAYLAEIALAAARAKSSGDDNPAHDARIATARFFAENLLPAAIGLELVVASGAGSVAQSDAVLVA